MSFMSPPSAPDPSAGITSGTQAAQAGLGVGNQIAQTGLGLGSTVAQGQQGYNTQSGESSQLGSMVGQNNPYGSLSYTQTGTGPNGTPIYSANTTLTPQQQQLFDQFQSTKGTAGGQASSLLSGANYGSQSPTKAIGDMASGLEGQMMSAYQAGNQPMQQTARQQMDTQLKNQGLQPGEPGYDNAMRSLDTSQTLANDTANANYANTAFGQASSLYGMPMQMAESMATFGSPQQPNQDFVNSPGLNIQPANLTGATANENQALTGGLTGSNQAINTQQQAVQDQYKAQMAQYSGMMNGIFGIGADALGVMAAPMTGGLSLGLLGAGGMGMPSGGATGGLY